MGIMCPRSRGGCRTSNSSQLSGCIKAWFEFPVMCLFSEANSRCRWITSLHWRHWSAGSQQGEEHWPGWMVERCSWGNFLNLFSVCDLSELHSWSEPVFATGGATEQAGRDHRRRPFQVRKRFSMSVWKRVVTSLFPSQGTVVKFPLCEVSFAHFWKWQLLSYTYSTYGYKCSPLFFLCDLDVRPKEIHFVSKSTVVCVHVGFLPWTSKLGQ